MTPEQIREVVGATLDELIKRRLIKTDTYPYILREVDKRLYDFFQGRGDGNEINTILPRLDDDPYIDVIYLQYRERKTIEWIAEHLEKDVSTIKRNKKRLILSIYNMLNV